MKVCKFKDCDGEVPEGKRNYCTPACYKKQQKIDQKAFRESVKKKKKVIILECENPKCKEKFEKRGSRKYCGDPCREQMIADRRVIKERKPREKAKPIRDFVLFRGNISSNSFGYVLDN